MYWNLQFFRDRVPGLINRLYTLEVLRYFLRASNCVIPVPPICWPRCTLASVPGVLFVFARSSNLNIPPVLALALLELAFVFNESKGSARACY